MQLHHGFIFEAYSVGNCGVTVEILVATPYKAWKMVVVIRKYIEQKDWW